MAADARNGIPATRLTQAIWRKSSHSGKEGNCVEIARLTGDVTAVRDSLDPHGPALVYPAHRTAAFMLATREGDFDGPYT
jgi:Domain of unknown function (DUF397)